MANDNNKVMVVEEGEQVGGGEFQHLPEDCIANIISFTTPRDACVLSLVSSSFRSAAQSDVVWERFLPSDYELIISQSSQPLTYSSNKNLYQHLCQNPLLIDSGKKVLPRNSINKLCFSSDHINNNLIIVIFNCRMNEWAELCTG